MTVGIVGLGLIGGSFAKAYHEAGWKVLAHNRSRSVLDFAKISGAVDDELTHENISECDLVLITVYPAAAARYLEAAAPHIGKKPVVIDCCGTKRVVCKACFPLAEKYGFTYLGGHPMAGREHSGFTYAKKSLFNNASMIFTPTKGPIESMEKLKKLFTSIGFTNIEIATPEEHDRKIAFTSQLAHVVSNAYIKSPTAQEHMGFSAGSYKDLTRVAKLNEDMWTELFLENPDNLADEIDTLIENLQEYSWAIRENDSETLRQLLKDGREKKAIIDGEIF